MNEFPLRILDLRHELTPKPKKKTTPFMLSPVLLRIQCFFPNVKPTFYFQQSINRPMRSSNREKLIQWTIRLIYNSDQLKISELKLNLINLSIHLIEKMSDCLCDLFESNMFPNTVMTHDVMRESKNENCSFILQSRAQVHENKFPAAIIIFNSSNRFE